MEAPRVIREHKGKISMGSIAAAIGIYVGILQMGMDPLAAIHQHPEISELSEVQETIVEWQGEEKARRIVNEHEARMRRCMDAVDTNYDICARRVRAEEDYERRGARERGRQ